MEFWVGLEKRNLGFLWWEVLLAEKGLENGGGKVDWVKGIWEMEGLSFWEGGVG